MSYPHILNMLVTDARKSGDNTAIAALSAEIGNPFNDSGLSADGNWPATHWQSAPVLTTAQLDSILDYYYTEASLTPPDWTALTGAQIRTQLTTDQATLAAAGMRIAHFDANNPGDYGALSTAASVTALNEFDPLQVAPTLFLDTDTAPAVLMEGTLHALAAAAGATEVSLWRDLADVVGDPASSWPADGTSPLTFEQSGVGDRPDVEATGLVYAGGGGTDGMYTSTNPTHTDAFTAGVVFNSSDTSISRVILGKWDSATDDRVWSIITAGTSVRLQCSTNGTSSTVHTIATITAGTWYTAVVRKSGTTVTIWINETKSTSGTAAPATLHNVAIPLTLGAEAISPANPHPGGGFAGTIRAAFYCNSGSLSDNECDMIARELGALAGDAALGWDTNLANTGPYPDVPEKTETIVWEPTSGTPPTGSPIAGDITTWLFTHHQAIYRFPTGEILFMRSLGMGADEDAPGQMCVFHIRNNAGTWSAMATLFPSQDDPDPTHVSGGRITAPGWAVTIGGTVYATAVIVDSEVAVRAQIARSIDKDGNLGTIFRVTEASYSGLPGYPEIALGEPSLCTAIRAEMDVYNYNGISHPTLDINEPNTIPDPVYPGRFIRCWKSGGGTYASTITAHTMVDSTGTEITGSARATPVPNSPNQPMPYQLSDGRIIYLGTPQTTGGIFRNPGFIGVCNYGTEADSTSRMREVRNALTFQSEVTDDPDYTLPGTTPNYGRNPAGGPGYIKAVEDPARDVLHIICSLQKERAAHYLVPVPYPVLQWPDKDGGADLKPSIVGKTRPIRYNSLSPRIRRFYFDGTNSYLSRTANLPGGTAGALICGFRPANLTGEKFLLCLADTAASQTNYMTLWQSGNKIKFRHRITVGDVANDVQADTTVLVAGTDYVVTVEASGSAWTIRINGTSQTLSVTSGANTGKWFGDVTGADTLTVACLAQSTGLSLFFKGLLGPIILTDSAVTSARRTLLEQYVARRCGATLA